MNGIRTALYGLLAAALLLGGAYVFGRCEGRQAAADAVQQARVDSLLHLTTPFHAHQAALVAAAAAERSRAETFRRQLQQQRARTDSAAAVADSLTALLADTAPTICRPWVEALQAAQRARQAADLALMLSDSAIAHLVAAADTLEHARAAAEQRATDLETALEALRAERCHVLFFTCLSRKTSYALGVGTGAAAVLSLLLLLGGHR